MPDLPLPVVCRTHGRAGRVKTLDAVSNVALCVSKSQEPLYREHYPDVEYVVHGDDVVGLAAKAQWMLDTLGSFWSLDDDVSEVRHVAALPGQPAKVEPDEAYRLLQGMAQMAVDAGVHLFGFAHNPRPLMYREFKPFRRTGFIPGHCYGIIGEGSRLWYHPDATTTDDYWISCINAYEHRTILKDQRFMFVHDDVFVGSGGGGQADHRTMSGEADATRFLQQKFGSVITVRSGGNAASRLKFEHQRQMIMPF